MTEARDLVDTIERARAVFHSIDQKDQDSFWSLVVAHHAACTAKMKKLQELMNPPVLPRYLRTNVSVPFWFSKDESS